jgi:hypothetical protein
MEQPVHDGPYARAAALVHTLGRCWRLERSNLAVAAATGVIAWKPPASRSSPLQATPPR